jgi:hypothetical protein
MSTKKQFVFRPEVAAIWRRLVVTRGASSESAALAQVLFEVEEELRAQLDEAGTLLYEAGRLDRVEMSKAFARYRARKAANEQLSGTHVPASAA